jgi:hypothetical protein
MDEYLQMEPDSRGRAALCETSREPVTSQPRHDLQRSWLLEQMSGSRNDFELHVAPHLFHGVMVHLEDRNVEAADDEQRRGLHAREGGTRQVGPSTP